MSLTLFSTVAIVVAVYAYMRPSWPAWIVAIGANAGAAWLAWQTL